MSRRPLENIRVVDLSRVFAMPFAGANLADLGAEVIKIDTCQAQFIETTRSITGPFPNNQPGELWWEQGGTFQTLNRGKRSLTLDLRSEEAQDILKELVSVSDIVLENFTPRVMARFGLDYASLRAVKPDLIMVSNTGYGHSGPWSSFGAMASALEPTHGTGAFMGYLDDDGTGELKPGTVPNKVGNSYTDFLATWTALVSIMAALLHRAKSGRGTWIDLAMYQAGASFIGEGLLAYSFNGQRTRRIGNRHPSMAPHGCYPCQGGDQWVTIAVRDDADWPAFCQAMDAPQLAGDQRFATAAQRLVCQDELDAVVSSWTKERTSYQVMETLQNAGVPAGPVLTAGQALSDAHFRHRGFFEKVTHPEETGLGTKEYIGRGWKFSESQAAIAGPAPLLGEANGYALSELLGLSQSRLDALEDESVTGTRPIGGNAPSQVPMETQVELGWVAGYVPDFEG
jgi:crotonobetainyl-CoA:carnitine CoA-transferase CaiB-like acyl-CoA transferase